VSTTMSQVFVRTDRIDRLLKVCEGYLRRWAKAVRDEWPDVPFLGSETSRATYVLPPVDGWCVLVDADPYRADFDLAQHLSEALATTALAVELRGGDLAWRYAAFEEGELEREEREPPEAFEPDAGSGGAPMPIYPDAVREVLQVLRTEGVPRERWFLRQDEFTAEGVDDEDAVWLDEIVTRPEKRNPVERVPRAPHRLKRKEGRLPFKPDVVGSTPTHRPLFVEIRSLFGTPTPQAVANLLEIERADRNRLQEPYLGGSADQMPSVYFEYSARGASEDELTKMLDLRRADFFRPRPPMSDFLDAALAIARKEQRTWRQLRASGFGLRFKLEGSSVEDAVDLDQPYQDYMEGRLAGTGPEEVLRRFLAQAAEDLHRPMAEAQYRSVADLLAPSLMSAEEAVRLVDEGVPSTPLGHGVNVVVTCRVGEGSALIDVDDLLRWDVSFEEALEVAKANLLRREKIDPKAPIPVDIAPDRRALALLSGPQPATHILMPGLAAVLRQVLDAEEVLCAIPDLDSFFAIDASEPETQLALRGFARARLHVAERPLTAELFRMMDDHAEPA